MTNLIQIKEEIRSIARSLFESDHVDEFILKFECLLGQEKIIDCIIQVSTDQGSELEVGFFTEKKIVDVTLSKGKVYFYSYPVTEIESVTVTDVGPKWTLTISGEKKFDYNVVKPGAITALSKYEKSILAWIFAK
jgi:hypothetical protein